MDKFILKAGKMVQYQSVIQLTSLLFHEVLKLLT